MIERARRRFTPEELEHIHMLTFGWCATFRQTPTPPHRFATFVRHHSHQPRRALSRRPTERSA